MPAPPPVPEVLTSRAIVLASSASSSTGVGTGSLQNDLLMLASPTGNVLQLVMCQVTMCKCVRNNCSSYKVSMCYCYSEASDYKIGPL